MRKMKMMLFVLLYLLVIFASAEDNADSSSNSLTCYTCTEVMSNYQCNRYAVDRPCPDGHAFCQTIHVMDANAETMSVVKSCADGRQCNSDTVGCNEMDAEGRQICISCCDSRLCNEAIPTNRTTAILQVSPSGACRINTPSLTQLVTIIIFIAKLAM